MAAFSPSGPTLSLRRSSMEQAKEISQAWQEALETYGEREEE
ncbi:hypothetical protein [Thermus arciformis]|nr:hypothetical protein [Thermus arciformis]